LTRLLVAAIAATEPEIADGLVLDAVAATAETIRDEDQYAGVRIGLTAVLATARLAFHVDVNIGDPVWPRPQPITLPRLLGGDLNLLGYPIAMVLAEKLVTAEQRGLANTRWRDYADVYALTRTHKLRATEVHAAIRAVAEHRGVTLRPLRDGLDGYAEAGQGRWSAWRARQHLDDRLPPRFDVAVDEVLRFADGCFHEAVDGSTWSPTDRAWR
jgi:hypothetical protein